MPNEVEFKKRYLYLHSNGTFIAKSERVVDMGGGPREYFDSPFVKEWWHVKDQESLDAIGSKHDCQNPEAPDA